MILIFRIPSSQCPKSSVYCLSRKRKGVKTTNVKSLYYSLASLHSFVFKPSTKFLLVYVTMVCKSWPCKLFTIRFQIFFLEISTFTFRLTKQFLQGSSRETSFHCWGKDTILKQLPGEVLNLLIFVSKKTME
jgi:WD40 repeat protein